MKRWISKSFIFLSLICAACGQVGSITGGEKDISAPRTLPNKINPPMESTSITPQEITIPFDEFIALNKPAKNIVVTPADVQLDYKIKGKSLVLTIKKGIWKPNTTYTIYLNHAIKDITEHNDSIMAYVFSTGSYLDSMQTAVQIEDAYTGKPLPNITVGLYTSPLQNDTSKIAPYYYSSTDDKGIAIFRHLKNKPYYVYAFNDENRNNRLDKTEKRATLNKPLIPSDSSVVDLPELRLMPPEITELNITNNKILPPGRWCIGFNRPAKNKFTFIDPQPQKIKWNKTNDSLTAFYTLKEKSGSLIGLLKKDTVTDTIVKRFFFKDPPKMEITSNLVNKVLGLDDTLKLTVNDLINTIDTTAFKIRYIPKGDSVQQPLPYSIVRLSDLTLGFLFARKNVHQVFLSLPPKSITSVNFSLDDSLNLDFTLQTVKDVGNLIISLDTIPASGILYVTNTKEGKIDEINVKKGGKKTFQLHHLSPGKYSYHFLYDTDNNGKWSTGSIFTHRAPEKIKWFTHISTVRANWDVKTELEFNASTSNENPLFPHK